MTATVANVQDLDQTADLVRPDEEVVFTASAYRDASWSDVEILAYPAALHAPQVAGSR